MPAQTSETMNSSNELELTSSTDCPSIITKVCQFDIIGRKVDRMTSTSGSVPLGHLLHKPRHFRLKGLNRPGIDGYQFVQALSHVRFGEARGCTLTSEKRRKPTRYVRPLITPTYRLVEIS